MECPHCKKELEIPQCAIENIFAYHKSVVVKTECCGVGVIIRPLRRFEATLYEGPRIEDDWGDEILPATYSQCLEKYIKHQRLLREDMVDQGRKFTYENGYSVIVGEKVLITSPEGQILAVSK